MAKSSRRPDTSVKRSTLSTQVASLSANPLASASLL